MKELFKRQKKLISNVKKYNSTCSKKNIDPSLSSLCFMTTWAITPGYFKLLDLLGKSNFNFFFYLKDILSISRYHNLKLSGTFNNSKNNKIENLIISYCSIKDFDKEGNYYDSYFEISSEKKNYTWFLISLDNKSPKKIKNNITILKKNNAEKYGFFFLLKKLVLTKKNLHCLSNSSIFTQLVKKEFVKAFSNKLIKNVIVNYEGTPFQHGIIKAVKEINKKTNIICYLHCAGWPLQTELVYKEKKIDNLIVSGLDQKMKLIKYLGWPKKKILLIPSLRFCKKKSYLFGGFVFIPFEIYDEKKMLKNFEFFILNLKLKSLNKLKPRIHPLNKESYKHKFFASKIEEIIKKNSNKFNTSVKKQSSFIFGSATGVCVQALEEGVTVYHLPNNEILDVFSEEIWPNINVKKQIDKIYKYSIKEKNKTFWVNNEKNKYNKYILPLLK
jgi:hypothetical protein